MSNKLWAKRYGRYARWEGMCWPIHIESGEDDSVRWKIRYGVPCSKEDLMYAASVMDAYAALIEATASKRAEVVRELKAIARKDSP